MSKLLTVFCNCIICFEAVQKNADDMNSAYSRREYVVNFRWLLIIFTYRVIHKHQSYLRHPLDLRSLNSVFKNNFTRQNG
jgi:hypothetical protein